jgi:hypothetical protein
MKNWIMKEKQTGFRRPLFNVDNFITELHYLFKQQLLYILYFCGYTKYL